MALEGAEAEAEDEEGGRMAFGDGVGEDSVDDLADSIRKAVKPVQNTWFSPNYRKKMYIKYYFTAKQGAKQRMKEVLDNTIEDLYSIEEVLTKKDTLVVIMDDEPNDTIINRMKYLYDHDGIFVIIHNIQRLQFNLLEHTLVPHMQILNEEEEKEFMKNHQILDKTQLPEISRFDPHALVVGVRPGNICLIQRPSLTAMKTNYYRVCV